MSLRLFAAALVLGCLLRAAALPLPGTHDTSVWKTWSYVAATEGVARMYGAGGSPPEHRVVSFHGAETTVDYPPLALYELGVAGRVYQRLTGGTFPDTTLLFVAIKLPAVLADVMLCVLLYGAVRRLAGTDAARWTAVAYWLNPAVLLDASALGYLDPLFVLPAVGALVAAAFDRPLVGGALAAASLATKPQAIVLMPAVAIALANGADTPAHGDVGLPPARSGRARRLALATIAAVVVLAAIVTPIVVAGGWSNMVLALSRLGRHDMLSANACNLWWIVGYLVRVQYSIGDMGAWSAIAAPTKILQISRFMEVGYPNPRVLGAFFAGGAMAWALWRGRNARDLWLVAALAAFLVHAYATLSAQVHENHLFAAVPLLVLASAGRRRFLPLAVAVSAIVALNLNLFYGISEDIGYALPRTATILDATVIVAAANCAALAWHARVFSAECSRAGVLRRWPVPA